ncbi:uncharacterized protein MYCFIDRAFT_195132 [Pseudocercospora fijiensis CIRAD86]|uniref:Uncharacterized protein n=1 Tax=Pseudocercospora fijiensis (strain CIRAD86) TaxID=383855 RepID=M3AH89_PSEFD|nr:uncharacterized protein MYCFIDRAFT_195132 [Pseudocercospora fijiensis CIRAD86]EME83941.1 hypothetical protein MYCFIDRAFT_195132 [Pseudocercospora fijiensis CIRAD86]
MLSRSNSSAGERLRRAKSMSSTHTAASGQAQRLGTTIAAQNTRLQAEVAAVEAYERARQLDELSAFTSKPRPNRRRSQASGRTEGSHFEEARRRSVNQAENVRPRPSNASSFAQNRASLPSQTRVEASDEGRVITRSRSVIPPVPAATASSCSRPASISAARHTRQRQSVDTDGSPAPRYSQCVKDRQATLQLSTLSNEVTSEEGTPFTAPRSPPRPARPSIRETQTDEDIRNMATSAYLQDLERKRIRERRSFIFSSFKKRRATGNAFNTSLPPFNYAHDGDGAPMPTNSAMLAPAIGAQTKSRHFSSSIKSRIKNAFRRTSRATSSMPAQHVHAKEFHFTIKDYDPSDESRGSVDFADPFMTIAAEEPRIAPPSPQTRPNSKVSTINDGSAKSRVTSWTNSTVAAFSSIRTNVATAHPKEQSPALHRTASHHTLRKKSSFLGGPIRDKLRRVSKADLKGSEESMGLYSALQRRMRSSKSSDPIHQPLISAPLELEPGKNSAQTLDTRASLPSQRYRQTDDARSDFDTTIRSITPEPNPYGIDIPSPVHEVTSPAQSNDDIDSTVLHHAVHGSGGSSARSGLQRRSAVKAPPPSQDALARRVERASNRWKSPLDELSPSNSRSTLRMSEDNPYILRSLSQAAKQVTPVNDLPHHRKAVNLLSPRSDVISPSVYSRATDGASPRPDSPEVYEPATTITITGHEVRRYSISPPKRIDEKQHRGHGSGTWRKWLSDEMNTTLGSNEKQIRLPQSIFVNPPAQRQDSGVSSLTAVPGHKRSVASITAELRSVSPLSFHSENRPASRASSQVSDMNGRYPVINASRNTSQHSIATSRKASPPPPPARQDSSEGRLLHSVAMAKKPSIDAALHSTATTRARANSKSAGLGQISAAARSQSALGSRQNLNVEAASGSGRLSAASATSPGKAFSRPKSAYELRVNYKNNANAASKPLEVRRKAIENGENSMLEDSTLFNISAGPYAAPRSPSTNQENTRPMDSPLQSLSSSEWLAAGSGKKRDARRFTASPAHSQIYGSSRKERSPGQRLVTNWLDERMSKSRENLQPSKESTPAFV